MEYTGPSANRYIEATPIAHTMGHHASERFQESKISIVERLINHLMQAEDNMRHRQKANKVVRDAFEIVNERTEENPVQILIRTVENAGSRKETVRFKYDDISVSQAVDVAPQHRIDEALKFIAQGTLSGSYKTTTTAAEALVQQLVGAADCDIQTYAISQKEEKERVAETAQ